MGKDDALLPDLQDEFDPRGIDIDCVGINNLRYPVTFADGTVAQSGIAEVSVGVSLPAIRRGTHMSRMVSLVDEYLQTLDPHTLPVTLKTAAARLDVSTVSITVTMPFSLLVTAPQSGIRSCQVNDLSITARMDANDQIRIVSAVTADVTSLCPCSKAISDYGAHNQRSHVTLAVTGHADDPYPLPVKQAAELIRASGSCPVYPIVKRTDERAITMQAYENPVFVEDIVRDLSTTCRERLLPHVITARNVESIHGHDATATLTWTPPQQR